MKHAILLLALVACGPGSGPTQPLGLLGPAGAIDVTQSPYNAIPDDGLDDRVAIVAAKAEACAGTVRRLYFPAGRFHMTRPSIPGQNISLSLNCDNLDVSGEGQGGTTVAMLGTGMLPGFPNPGTWKMWQVGGGASNVHVHDIALEGGTEVVNTEEQTHLTETGHSTGATWERVTATMPQRPAPAGTVSCHLAPNGTMCERPVALGGPTPFLCHTPVPPVIPAPPALSRATCTVTDNGSGGFTWTLVGWYGGGDCFRFFGEEATPVANAVLDGVHGTDCDRATFSLQRGIHGLKIRDSSGVTRMDTPFDSETTGSVGYSGLEVDGVELSRGGAGGGYTVTLGGSHAGVSSGIYDCRGGTIADGGLRLIDVGTFEIRNCTVNSGSVSVEATVDIRKRATLITFRNSRFIRPAGAVAAPVLYITHASGASPTAVRLIDTWIDQHTVNAAIRISGLLSFTMVRGGIRYHAAPWNPPTNAAEAAAIVANSDPGGGRVDTVSLSGVELVAPPGSFASLVQQGAHALHPQGRLVSLVNVKATGLRNALVSFKGAAKARLYRSGVAHDAPALCVGNPSCP